MCKTLILFLFSLNLLAQTKTIVLKPVGLGIRSNEFYVASVESKHHHIGQIFEKDKWTLTHLSAGSIAHFLAKNFNAQHTDSLMPIYLHINDLKVDEKIVGVYKVSGSIVLDIDFRTYRDAKLITLSNSKSTAHYTRSTQHSENIEPLIRKMLENHLRGFTKWFSENKKSPLLATKTRLIIHQDSLSQLATDTTLGYDFKRPLVWNDFMAPARFGSRWAAQVFTTFGFEAWQSMDERTVNLNVRINVWVNKNMCWVRPDAKNDYTLDHEQLHFDVTKMVAERFRKKIETMSFTVEDFSSEIQYVYLEYHRMMSETQHQYDEETNHGLNKTEQKRWADKVRTELKILNK